MTDELVGGRSGVSPGDVVDSPPVARMRLLELAEIDMDRVPSVLGAGEAAWLGERTDPGSGAMRSYVCDLELHAGMTERALFRKSAIVSLGDPDPAGDAWLVPIEWRSTTMTALFPVLVGQLRIGPHAVSLSGRYAPPGGRLGYLIDTALFGIAARQTGRWFLRTVAAALRQGSPPGQGVRG
jgi:hypothetical protein